jgi:ribosomal protein S18 acetylase RimI-like enzyme
VVFLPPQWSGNEQALEQRLREKGCLKSYLLVTKDNLEAIQFYEASGWERMELYIYGKELG